MWRFDSFSHRLAALADTGERITYARLIRFAAAIGNAVPSRRLVFCLCANSVGSLAGYAAFLQNRLVPLLLDSGLDRMLRNRLTETFRPDYFWVPRAMQAEFPGASEVPLPPVVDEYGYTLLETPRTSPTPLHDDLALLLATSGSTGSPHLVRQSYENLTANAASIVDYLKITADERPITTLPMNYTYGLSIINSHLSVGATALLTAKTLMQKEFWRFFVEESATSFGGVPYTYEMLNRLRWFGMDLPSLKTMTQAGGKLPVELHRQFAEHAQASGRRFVVMYGQTEATARMSYLPPDKSLEKCGSIGVAIPGGCFSLVDADGDAIEAPHVTGELVYQGRNVTLGYAESADDLIKGNENGYTLRTGDLARRDEDGYYYIVGRKKRFIKLFGNRVNLDETERLVESAFCGLHCACAGRDEQMSIFVTDAAQTAAVKRFIAEKTGIHATAFSVAPIETIPKNGAGKTLYAELQGGAH
jgi:acyl-coenzyme A synthetase/AMP-(fatty) acid ligase